MKRFFDKKLAKTGILMIYYYKVGFYI